MERKLFFVEKMQKETKQTLLKENLLTLMI